MNKLRTLLPLFAAMVISAATPALAAPMEIWFQERLYGTDPGRVAPAGGADPLFNNMRPTWVEDADYLNVRFRDVFDFADLNFHSISSITLTLTHNINELTSPFSLMVAGFDDFTLTDAFASPLSRDGDILNPWVAQTFVLDATTDTGATTAFARTLSAQELAFSFRDDALPFLTPNSMLLSSASLSIEGIAVVPLPAPILLLLAALGGLGVMSRRKAKADPTIV
ncbi:VPLPA-CTERM sorting domain-containing protein [Jannaschia ovalis]|uniref:VPLPA-CTERM sorting domain-containing protein n=1 Tax=Jannaschia ovalis TaxID=3038773 RepID=A0ABY8LFP5_9RHOB|nr:VPLPA-CTERM sorting domain-containing protein [Jannaschia sp. GRR-S6-38]WGH80126.1 VPLPA-CTERM sorting domain-containing protein [Jannaschia sp. GRR-S6-38]